MKYQFPSKRHHRGLALAIQQLRNVKRLGRGKGSIAAVSTNFSLVPVFGALLKTDGNSQPKNMKKKTNAVSADNFILESARLGFRLMDDGDLGDLIALDTDHEIRAHFPTGISSRRECQERIVKNRKLFSKHGYSDFIVIHKPSRRFAGRAGFGITEGDEIEVGYVFLREFWGQGLASESVVSLLAWASDSINTQRIIAYTPVNHAASINVMKKAGMRIFKTEFAHGVECVFYEYRLRG